MKRDMERNIDEWTQIGIVVDGGSFGMNVLFEWLNIHWIVLVCLFVWLTDCCSPKWRTFIDGCACAHNRMLLLKANRIIDDLLTSFAVRYSEILQSKAKQLTVIKGRRRRSKRTSWIIIIGGECRRNIVLSYCLRRNAVFDAHLLRPTSSYIHPFGWTRVSGGGSLKLNPIADRHCSNDKLLFFHREMFCDVVVDDGVGSPFM